YDLRSRGRCRPTRMLVFSVVTRQSNSAPPPRDAGSKIATGRRSDRLHPPNFSGRDPMPDYKKLFDLTGRKALVLGAASGIGKASAEALGALGAEVHCADIDLAQAEATAAAIRTAGGTAPPSRADAASGSEIEALVAQVHTTLG